VPFPSDDDLERPPFPWLGLAIGVLAVIGLFAVAGWIVGTFWTLIRLLVVVGIVALVVMAIRRIGARR
jgi:hypothetical protein